jgi:hypothetical protein
MNQLVSKFEQRVIDNNFRLDSLDCFAQVSDFSHNNKLSLECVKNDMQACNLEGYNIVIANGEFVPELSTYKVDDLIIEDKGFVNEKLFQHNKNNLLNSFNIKVSKLDKLNIIYWFDDSLEADAVYNLKQNLCINSDENILCREIFINSGVKIKSVNFVMSYSVAKKSKLEVFQEHINSKKMVIWQTHQVVLAEDSLFARFDWVVSSLVNLCYQNILFVGDNSRCVLNNAADVSGDQRFANIVKITHHGKNCQSNQSFCSVAKAGAIGIVKSKVLIDEHAVKSEANQVLRGLLLDDSASLMMSPELEIDNDDVACYHGASVGSLDKDGLMYLQSRGFSESQAYMFMMEALFKKLSFGFNKGLFINNMSFLKNKWHVKEVEYAGS